MRRLFLLLGAIVGLNACHSTPAALRRHRFAASETRADERTLAQWLDRVAAAPESADGKLAGGRFLQSWSTHGSLQNWRAGDWKVRVVSEWPAAYFDTLFPAAAYDVCGLQQRHTRAGAGVALVGSRKNTYREPIESLYPPELITRPVTAVFQPGPGRTMTVALKDPRRHTALAADFTAPFAELVGHAALLARTGFGGLMGTRTARERGSGLFLLEPYDPQKTPVLFVHGILSTPLAWANVTNDLWGNAEFRRRYQIWHYHYPTSAPFLYSAKIFRQQLAAAREKLDPGGRHPASARLHVVAHSMGGLLSRTLVTNSGEAIWNRVFRVPSKTLRASTADLAEVTDILHWKARPDIRHVIFIAVPHRGSPLPRQFAGWVGRRLTRLPENFTRLYARLHRDNPEALQPAFRDSLSRGKLRSIDTLSIQHPMVPPLNALPFVPWATIHSIIGDRGRGGPLEQRSDGVVPYTSSHLDSAVSELIVPTGHSAYEHPRALAEILRILLSAP